MISGSDLWKEDLVKMANKLLKRIIQKKWSRRSVFTMEKELFIGFYSVRKLIEANEVPNELLHTRFELLMFPRKNLSDEEIGTVLPYEPSPGDALMKKISVREICNQFIHSYHLLPFGDKSALVGFFINSDFQSKKGIYLITIFDIAEIFRLCAGRKGLVDVVTT